jgi:hypothetical protein
VLGTIAADRTAAALHVSSPLGGGAVGSMAQLAARHAAYVDGYVRAFQVAGGITTLAFFVSLLMPAGVGHHSSHAAPSPEATGAAGH